MNFFPLPDNIEMIPEDRLSQPKWMLARILGTKNVVTNGYSNVSHMSNRAAASVNQLMDVTLDENCRMTPETHWQDVRHLTFSSCESAAYGPGDVLTIYPHNLAEDVNQMLTRMDWTKIADEPIHFLPSMPCDGSRPYPLPPIFLTESSTTLRTLLTEHLDLTAIPRRSFFSLIAHFTDDQFHKDRLLEFTKPEYIDELYDYTTRPRRGILEVLQEFESVKIPWQWAASVLPELRGRQFSIASGGQLKFSAQGNTRFELLVAIVKYKTVIKKVREGVCTRYLANLPMGSQLRVTLQKGGLAIGKDEHRRPVMMVGPGTGVAPMRSMIWERLQLAQQIQSKPKTEPDESPPVPQSMLFFGCRSQDADFFYKDEWSKMETLMRFKLHTAFSRDRETKVYVQDVIRAQADSVCRLLLENDGIVYVCGSSGNMPKAVRATLVDAFAKHAKMDHESAMKYIEGMERQGRYKQETW